MHLISATIRNYRIHREMTVNFDESLTLISGPNESGKSTLIEAIHRGLFLRSKTGGEVQKSMGSSLPGASGHPEVELSFRARGQEFYLSKRFSGASGTTKLTESGGSTWHGAEAESRLQDLLQVEDIGGGRGIESRIAQQWAHLWVWQGKSGEDPCQHTGAEHAKLLQRLQQSGGAAAMQSECDSRVASHFSEMVDATWTKNDKARQGSDLQKAETAVNEAEDARRQAAERVDRLDRAVTDYETAVATIERVTADLERLEKERFDVAAKLSQVEKLTAREKLQKAEADSAAERHTSLKQADDQITGLREKKSAGEEKLAPEKKQLSKLEVQLSELRKDFKTAEETYTKACETTRYVRLRRDHAVATVRFFEKKSTVGDLSKKAEQIAKRQEEMRSLRERLAKLPEVDGAKLKKLDALKNDLGKAEAALSAMAAGVEVISSKKSVRVGDALLSAGQRTTVTEMTEVVYGDELRLRIQPGGGDGLARARQHVADSREKLQNGLDALGLATVAAASDALNQRTDLQKQIDREETTLQGMDAAKVPALLAQAQEEQAAAQAEVDRRKEQVGDAECHVNLNTANERLTELEKKLHQSETAEQEAKATHEAAQNTVRKADEQRQEMMTAVGKEETHLNELKAQLRLLLENHGDDEARARGLQKALSAKKEAESTLNATRKLLAELQPDQLERDHKRLERAWQAGQLQQQEAREKRAESQATLRSDGNDDPKAALALAEARLESARQHYDSIRRKAEAFRLLDALFTEEQRALADRFTQPLVDKIAGYLQCLFGPDARAEMTLADNSFTGMQLIRSGNGSAAVPFESLSGGAREQVAAGVRLAMAELLAGDHDDCLPVVFDDAFAYSDPQRVQTLQRMLDLAASRGLQVIVLTCDPSDYAGLGATETALDTSTPVQTPSAEPASFERAAEEEVSVNG